jgi:hypothetical protein
MNPSVHADREDLRKTLNPFCTANLSVAVSEYGL